MNEPIVRPPRPEDVPAIVALFAAAFGRRISSSHYTWKIRTRPAPVENATVVFAGPDSAVFHLAGIPCRAQIGGAEQWAMIAVDGMTSPAARRQGLLSTHLPLLFNRWRDAGVPLVLGLPNQQWGSRTRALGWKPLFPLKWLILPLAPERLLARRLGLPILARMGIVSRVWRRRWTASRSRDVVIEATRVAPADLDDLWMQSRSATTHSIVRDRAWVTWRYLESPDVRYELVVARRAGASCGYAAYRVFDWGESKSAVIAEMWVKPGDSHAFAALGQAVLDRLLADRVEVVRTLAPPGSLPYAYWRSLGFFPTPHAFSVEHMALDRSLDSAALAQPASWWMTAGDFDVV